MLHVPLVPPTLATAKPSMLARAHVKYTVWYGFSLIVHISVHVVTFAVPPYSVHITIFPYLTPVNDFSLVPTGVAVTVVFEFYVKNQYKSL